jgi:hypothetical protein
VTPTYEEQQAARKARLNGAAERLRRSGAPAAAARAEKMADAIPPGVTQRDAKDAALAVPGEAERPDVSKDIGLLTEQLRKAEADRTMFKKVNAIIRQNARAGEDAQVAAICQATGFSQAVARDLLKPDLAGRLGFPPAMISANNASIRRLKDQQNEVWQRMLSGIDATVLTSPDGYLRKLIEQVADMNRREGRELQRDNLELDEEIQRSMGRGRGR